MRHGVLFGYSYGQDIAWSGVQHGILRRAEDESEAMSPMVAKYDQIDLELACYAQEFYLHTPDLDSPARLLGAWSAGESCQVRMRSLNQFFLSLDGCCRHSVRGKGRNDGLREERLPVLLLT